VPNEAAPAFQNRHSRNGLQKVPQAAVRLSVAALGEGDMLGVAQIKGELPRRGVALPGFHLEAATGIVASTCILSLVDILTRIGAASQALVTPYTRDVQDTIIATYAALGFACPAERRPGQFQLRCGG
jgi:hypothetical protein